MKRSFLPLLRLCFFAFVAMALLPQTAWAQGGPAPVTTEKKPIDARLIKPGFAGLSAGDKVALMPIDVELFSLSAGGVPEPKADWTAAAQRFMGQALAERKAKSKLSLVTMADAQADDFAEQLGLHAAVARSIAAHHLGGQAALPSKEGALLWSFGDAMQGISKATGSRYGLFVFVRDSYASAERKVAMVALALLGVGLSGGVQSAYASLVDLQTGDVLWFNRMIRASGDLREAEPAKESIAALMENFPEPR